MATPKQTSWLQIQRTSDPDGGDWIDVPTGRYNLKQGQEAWAHLARLKRDTVYQTSQDEVSEYPRTITSLYRYRLIHVTVDVHTLANDVVLTPTTFDRWRAGEHDGNDVVTAAALIVTTPRLPDPPVCHQ